MVIEVGKEYTIYPMYKKSFEQLEVWKDNESNDRCRVESNFRSGAYIVKITNEEEKELLESYLNEDADGQCEPECEFSEFEMVDYFDECACFYYPMLSENSAVSDEWIDEELCEHGTSWFFDNNWDHEYTEVFMGLPLTADEVDPDNRYKTRF